MITTGDKSGVEVSVRRVGGQAFKEYDVKHTEAGRDQPSTTSCWLESEEDATFEIKIHLGTAYMQRNSPHDWKVHVYVDGRKYSVSEMRFTEDGQIYVGQLKFAALRTTDDDDEVTLRDGDLLNLGKIRIDLLRGKSGDCKQLTGASRVMPTPDLGVASEKGKKLGGRIGYTDKTPIAHKQRFGVGFTPYHDTRRKPYHRLEFNYRSRPVLQLLNVVQADKPAARIPTPSVAPPTKPQPGPSRKRKSEVIDIDDDEDQVDLKPDNKDIMRTRVGWLENKLQSANSMLKRQKVNASREIVDLTGDD